MVHLLVEYKLKFSVKIFAYNSILLSLSVELDLHRLPPVIRNYKQKQWRIQDFPKDGGANIQNGCVNLLFC